MSTVGIAQDRWPAFQTVIDCARQRTTFRAGRLPYVQISGATSGLRGGRNLALAVSRGKPRVICS